MNAPLLVVAGDASGDVMAARVVGGLGVDTFGVGGPALRGAGQRQLARAEELSAMGMVSALTVAPRVAAALAEILRAVAAATPRAALLVGWSEPNAALGWALRRRHVPVLWYAPPQVWAWRPGRARRLAAAADRLAVILPFESRLWREHGAPATHVGHPAHDAPREDQASARLRLGLAAGAELIAVLPGSRPHEVRRLLPPMLGAVAAVRAARAAAEARVLLTPALGPLTLAWAARRAREARVEVIVGLAHEPLPAFDVALAASGTVTAECVVAGVAPVVAWRGDPLTYAVARRAVRTPWIGLPNVVLERGAFPELVQRAVTPAALARAAIGLLDDLPRARRACGEASGLLAAPTGAPPATQVAALLRPWLERGPSPSPPRSIRAERAPMRP